MLRKLPGKPAEGCLRGCSVPNLATNVLYYGDNLDILRRYLPDAAVDLVYLDPPFNSTRYQTTRPGLRRPNGSSAALIERITATASAPRCSTRKERRVAPIPCSPVTVPPSLMASR